jgi:hypothetical protein
MTYDEIDLLCVQGNEMCNDCTNPTDDNPNQTNDLPKTPDVPPPCGAVPNHELSNTAPVASPAAAPASNNGAAPGDGDSPVREKAGLLPGIRAMNLSAVLLPKLKTLDKRQQEKFLDLVKNQGKDVMEALEILDRLETTKAFDRAINLERDNLGYPIPKGLKDAFGDRTLKDSHYLLGQMITEIRRLQSRNPWMLTSQILESLEDARDRMKGAFVHVVHQGCKGEGCSECRHSGWLPEWRHKELLEQLALIGEQDP